MRTVALSEHTATRLAYRQYLGLLAEDDRGFRQAFRTAFFRAMREQLTPRQYEVLWMIEVEGLSCKQCAERLGISPSAVSRHCSRGKKRLRTLLAYNLELRHQYFRTIHERFYKGWHDVRCRTLCFVCGNNCRTLNECHASVPSHDLSKCRGSKV